MRAFKLLRKRKDGSLGSLFLGRAVRLPIGAWLEAEDRTARGYASRPGWHCTEAPSAPHLSMEGREWYEVEIKNFQGVKRPAHQGGYWFVAQRMKIIRPASEAQTS